MDNLTVSFENALQNVIKVASNTVKNIKSVFIQYMQIWVNHHEIAHYCVNTKIS